MRASKTSDKYNQSTESADFDKLDGWIRYFDIKQTWSAWVIFSVNIGSNKNILMDKCTFHVSGDRAGYQDRTFWLTDFFIWKREFTYSIRELSNSSKELSNASKELSIYV